jgi:ABC-2 type transport system permease protein
MWLRQMKRFIRTRSRIIGTIVQPLFFLFILAGGFSGAEIPGITVGYIQFLAPGIVAMAILFSSMYTGISVLWDKKFGFLQEILVAPVSRFTIIIGRTLGGATTALIQGTIVLIIALLLGVRITSLSGFILGYIFMLLIGFTSVGFGLIMASKMDDFEGFQIIMTLIIMPLFFISSAIFPIATNPRFPDILVKLSFLNPLFYMVDGLRGSLTGAENILHPFVNLVIVSIICIIVLGIGGYLFNKTEA